MSLLQRTGTESALLSCSRWSTSLTSLLWGPSPPPAALWCQSPFVKDPAGERWKTQSNWREFHEGLVTGGGGRVQWHQQERWHDQTLARQRVITTLKPKGTSKGKPIGDDQLTEAGAFPSAVSRQPATQQGNSPGNEYTEVTPPALQSPLVPLSGQTQTESRGQPSCLKVTPRGQSPRAQSAKGWREIYWGKWSIHSWPQGENLTGVPKLHRLAPAHRFSCFFDCVLSYFAHSHCSRHLSVTPVACLFPPPAVFFLHSSPGAIFFHFLWFILSMTYSGNLSLKTCTSFTRWFEHLEFIDYFQLHSFLSASLDTSSLRAGALFGLIHSFFLEPAHGRSSGRVCCLGLSVLN